MMLLEKFGLVDADGKVTLEGWQLFSELLDLFGPYPRFAGIFPSPFGIFEKFMSKVVPCAIKMILIIGDEVYFTYRHDKFWTGHHIPGSYQGPGETLVETCQRIADREVPGVKIISAEIISAVTHPDSPRFHDTCLLTVVTFEGEPKNEIKGKWFNITEPPADLIEVHQPYLPIITAYMKSKKLI